MDILVARDIIKDDRGNYYVAVKRDGNELTLVNAYVEFSFHRILNLNEGFKDYEHEFFGKQAMDTLKSRLHHLKDRDDVPGSVYDLEEVISKYSVKFIDTVDYYVNPKAN